MKPSKREIRSNASAFPKIQTEPHSQLTSFAGIQIYSQLFSSSFGLKDRLRRCTSHLTSTSQYSPSSILFLLVTHVILGFSRLRDVSCYEHDPLVMRFLGLNVTTQVVWGRMICSGIIGEPATADLRAVKMLCPFLRKVDT